MAGKVLIYGGSGGIGSAAARILHSAFTWLCSPLVGRSEERLSAIAPSLTRTPRARAILSNEPMASAVAGLHALERLGTPEDIAARGAFLLFPEVDWITGQIISVDGGISREKIEMTTPVKAAQSQKIAMTTPVTVTGEDSFTVAFIMPSAYSLETLPLPKDSRIRFTSIPAHQMAAIRFSGYFQQDTIHKNKERLSQWLQEQGLETEGDFIVAGYNPPWVPGFLARNEVMIKVRSTTYTSLMKN